MINKKSQIDIWRIIVVIIIILLVLLAIYIVYVVSTSESQELEQNESYFVEKNFSINMNSSDYIIRVDCENIKIYLEFENKTIEFCEWFKNK